MDQYADAFQRQAVEVMGFDDLQPFVHHRRRVDGDFRAHAPVGVLERLRGRHRGEEVPLLATERAS